MVELLEHQKIAVNRLRSGSILCGGVGSGKSITALAYFFKNYPTYNLYVITTARKRDTREWNEEIEKFGIYDIFYKVDSWNKLWKYEDVTNAFFIFDEQRVVGSGAWVKTFLRIAKENKWILLSATPGDVWMDYVPVFIANGYYRNRTEFISRHVRYDPGPNFPKIKQYLEVDRLERLKKLTLVNMEFKRKTCRHVEMIFSDYDKNKYYDIVKKRWNPWTNAPIQNASEYCFSLRKVVNSSEDKLNKVRDILKRFKKAILFYNFDYELEAIRILKSEINYAEYNGHKHESIPTSDSWIYVVQYSAGSEGWNCVSTNTVIFYSMSYSYRIMEQAAGRIDRLNTLYEDLYYFCIRSLSTIDMAIGKCLEAKKDFNEKTFKG